MFFCNIRTTHDLRRNYGLAKSKFQNVRTTQELEKTVEKEDQELLMLLKENMQKHNPKP
jgi:hypothetical protein